MAGLPSGDKNKSIYRRTKHGGEWKSGIISILDADQLYKGAVVLLVICKSSDYFRERSLHTVLCLTISLVGLIILAAVDAIQQKGVAYFAAFLMAAGS